jgi:hypothetical protein
MNTPRPTWTRVLLLLPSILLAAEPAPTALAPAPTRDDAAKAASTPLRTAFDLRGSAVRELVRVTAARQSDTGYRIESTAPAKQDLAEALKQERPAPRRPTKPRLPDRRPGCDGFLSCGIETLLGLHDDDGEVDEEYGRRERHRLMNEGSFTDKSACEACQAPPAPTL